MAKKKIIDLHQNDNKFEVKSSFDEKNQLRSFSGSKKRANAKKMVSASKDNFLNSKNNTVFNESIKVGDEIKAPDVSSKDFIKVPQLNFIDSDVKSSYADDNISIFDNFVISDDEYGRTNLRQSYINQNAESLSDKKNIDVSNRHKTSAITNDKTKNEDISFIKDDDETFISQSDFDFKHDSFFDDSDSKSDFVDKKFNSSHISFIDDEEKLNFKDNKVSDTNFISDQKKKSFSSNDNEILNSEFISDENNFDFSDTSISDDKKSINEFNDDSGRKYKTYSSYVSKKDEDLLTDKGKNIAVDSDDFIEKYDRYENIEYISDDSSSITKKGNAKQLYENKTEESKFEIESPFMKSERFNDDNFRFENDFIRNDVVEPARVDDGFVKEAAARASLSQLLQARKAFQNSTNEETDISDDLINSKDRSMFKAASVGIKNSGKNLIKAASVALTQGLMHLLHLMTPVFLVIVIIFGGFLIVSNSVIGAIASVGSGDAGYDLNVDGDGAIYAFQPLSQETIDDYIAQLYRDYPLIMNEKREILLRYALSKVGCEYNQSKRMDANIFDCSSLAGRSYLAAGVHISSSDNWIDVAAELCRRLENKGRQVRSGSLYPGDLLFYSGSTNGRYKNITHVAIYIGKIKINGNYVDKSVEAKGRNYGVVVSDTRSNTVSVCRPLIS